MSDLDSVNYFYDNRNEELSSWIFSMNRDHETIIYLISMLTRKGVQETQASATYEDLRARIRPIYRAILFVIHDGSMQTDPQDEFPNKQVDSHSDEYYQRQRKLESAFGKLSNMRTGFLEIVGTNAFDIWSTIDLWGRLPFDDLKPELIRIFQNIQSKTIQNLQHVEEP